MQDSLDKLTSDDISERKFGKTMGNADTSKDPSECRL